jgi:hypothetical protein
MTLGNRVISSSQSSGTPENVPSAASRLTTPTTSWSNEIGSKKRPSRLAPTTTLAVAEPTSFLSREPRRI